jgi:hypothetical protein
MSAPETTIDPSALPEAARIRELLVGNGWIALLYTILTAAS